MLRLLAQRGEQGYEDIAALKGIGAEEVRAQVRDAVKQLEDEGLPPPAIPLETAEGDATPPPPAPPKPPAKPESPKPKPQPAAQEAPEPVAALPKGEPKPPLRRELKLLENRGLWAIVAGAAIVVLFVVILLVGGDDGGSDSTTTNASGAAQESGSEAPVANSKKITKAVLKPVDGGEAAGSVIFGRVKNTLALQVLATGLEPTANGQAYAIWLSASPQKMLPLAATPVNKSGKIAAQFEAPVEVLGYLANETFKDIAITLVDESRLESSLKAATKAKESPEYTGTEVLRGEVTGPIVGAAIRKEEREEGE